MTVQPITEIQVEISTTLDYYDNFTDEPSDICFKKNAVQFATAITPVIFIIIVLFSCVGNTLVVWVLVKYENLKSLTNTFLLNLALSDLIFTFGLPFWAYYYMYGWTLGDPACKAVNFVFYTGYYSSIIFLTVLTIHRYMAVVHPMSVVMSRKSLHCYATSIVIWIISLCAAIPQARFNSVVYNDADLFMDALNNSTTATIFLKQLYNTVNQDLEMAFNSNSTHVNDSYVYDEELIPMCEDDYEKTTGVCYATIFCLSILGNGFLVCALTCYEDLKRATNLFMFCLALFDLLFTLTLPFWCVELLHHWVFGDVVCKIMTGAYFVGIYGSLILLTAMTLDRFVVVVVRSYWLTRSRRLKCSKAACIGAWIISLIACLRDSIAAKAHDEHINKYSCQSTSTVDDNVGYYTQLILLFLVPFAIIVFCYTKIILTLMSTSTRQKYRTVILVLCIVIAFFICWGPYHIIIVLMSIYDFDPCKHYQLHVAFIVCRILAFSHCCINPALYIVRGKRYNAWRDFERGLQYQL
ncbi:hypothetical protein cypCar_00014104 [Cyprinus carpio]|nr:hypothetical protein cypCar_00014104 [Cyprinus carpio]